MVLTTKQREALALIDGGDFLVAHYNVRHALVSKGLAAWAAHRKAQITDLRPLALTPAGVELLATLAADPVVVDAREGMAQRKAAKAARVAEINDWLRSNR